VSGLAGLPSEKSKSMRSAPAESRSRGSGRPGVATAAGPAHPHGTSLRGEKEEEGVG